MIRNKMLGNMEQSFTIKFCAKLKKTKQEAYEILEEAYGDDLMSKASSTGGLSDSLKEMNKLMMNTDLEQRRPHVTRNTLNICESY